MKALLEFDDAGAADSEPVKGVTVGDIRAWHDAYDQILTTWADCRDLLSKERARVEALEAALREIARQKLTHEHIDDFGEEEDHAGDYEGAYDIIVQIARTALAEGQTNPWPQDAIDQEMIERTDDGWSLPPAEQDK